MKGLQFLRDELQQIFEHVMKNPLAVFLFIALVATFWAWRDTQSDLRFVCNYAMARGLDTMEPSYPPQTQAEAVIVTCRGDSVVAQLDQEDSQAQ